MDDTYYEAAIPEPWTILGRRLRPFSLGHIIILSRVGSAFVGNGTAFAPLEIVQAVFLCSHTYKENLALLDDPELVPKIKAWRRSITGENKLLVRLGLKKPKEPDWDEKARMLVEYFKQADNIPVYSANDGKTTTIDIPSPQIVKVTLMRYMGFSEDELMDRPWNMCIWDFVTLKAMEGQVSVYNAEEMEEAKKKAEELAKKMKESKKNGTR